MNRWQLDSNQSMGSIFMGIFLVLVISTLLWRPTTAFARKPTPQKSFWKPPRKSNNNHQKGPLERCIDISYEQGRNVIVLVDSNNVRGKTDFEWTNRDLLKLLRVWQSGNGVEVICVIDHGLQSQVFSYDFGLVVMAGPHRTADDVIAAASKWLTTPTQGEISSPKNSTASTSTPNVFVVTSDRELTRRCLQNNRPGSLKKKKRQPQRDFVKVFDSPAFVRALETLRVDLNTNNTDSGRSTMDKASVVEHHSFVLEDDLRRFGMFRPPWSCQSERQLALEQGPWRTQVLQSASFPPLQRQVFNEKTWHRVLFAENLRRRLAAQTLEQECASEHLNEYRSRFQEMAKDEEKVTTMLLDHRIQYDPFQQQALLYYLDQSIDSTITESTDNTLASEAGDSTITSVDSSAEFLRKLVQTLPEASKQDLLERYKKEAPIRLQFSSSSTLCNLLQLVATQESNPPQWTLLSRKYDDKDRPRRRGKHVIGQYRLVVDEALVEIGNSIESKWFELLDAAM